MWKLFLSRFRFVRELLVANNGASEVQGTPRTRNRKPRIDWNMDWRVSPWHIPNNVYFVKRLKWWPWLWRNAVPTEEGALQCCGCILDGVNDVQHVPSLFMSWSPAKCCAYPLAGRTAFYYDLCVWYTCSCTWQACCGTDAQLRVTFFFSHRLLCYACMWSLGMQPYFWDMCIYLHKYPKGKE